MNDYTQLIFLVLLIVFSIFSSVMKKKKFENTNTPPGNDDADDEKGAKTANDFFAEWENMLQPPPFAEMKNVRPRATKTRLQELSELSAGTTVTAPPAVFTNPEPPKPSIPQYNAVNTDSQNTARQIDPPHQTGSLSGETVTIAARAKALKEKLAEPAGIREAYTLREILDRPIAFRPRYVHGRYGKKI